MTLVNQPSAMPTRKVSASIIAGIIANASIALADAFLPGVGTALSPQITAVITAGVMILASYFTKEKA
jgi:hypothetical protein